MGCFIKTRIERSIVIILSILTVLLGYGTARAQTADQRPNAIRVGGDREYLPFESINSDGTPVGFNIALMQAISQKAGLSVEFELASWPKIMDAFHNGRIDVVAMFISEERRTEFLFSDPFTIVYHKILVREGDPVLRSLEELAGHRVLVQQGAWAHEHLLRHVPEAQLIAVASEIQAIRLLSEGQGQAVFISRIGARMAIRSGQMEGLRVSSPPLAPCEYAFAVRSDRTDLIRMIDTGLAVLLANGRFEDLHDRWFGDLVPRSFSLREAIRKAAWVLGPLLGLAIAGVAFSWLLRRKVAERTTELAASYRTLRMLFEHGQDIVCATDATGTLTYVSPSVQRYGYAPEEMLSHNFLAFIVEQDRKDIASKFAQAIETGEDVPSEFRLRAKDGSEPWTEARGTVPRDDGGAVTGMVVVLRDITDRRRAETALRHRIAMQKLQSELSLQCLQLAGKEMDRAIQDALRELGLFLDADRTYLFRVDSQTRTMSNTHEWCAPGIEPQQANLQCIPEDSAPWWMSRLRRCESLNIESVDTLPAEAANEKEILQAQSIQSLFVAPVFWREDLLGFMGLDFVRKRQVLAEEDRMEIETMANTLGLLLAHQSSEQSLREQERLYHTLVEDMPGLICRFKTDGTLTVVNDEYCRYFEKRREDLIGKSFMPLIPEEDQQRVRDTFESCGLDNPTVEYQHRVILPDGRIRWIRWIDRALFNSGGEITEYQSIGVDITEQRDLESQLAQSQKMETVGMLAGGIAHDFNNGLQAIRGYTELVLNQMSPSDVHQADLREVLAASDRAQRLTRQLLAFSRRQPLNPEELDLNVLIKTHEKMLGRMLGEDILINMDLARDLGAVRADAGQVEQIVMNLAVNARDAMPHGGRLSFRTGNLTLEPGEALHHIDARPGRFACIAVSDTGSGMQPETAARIFEPFFTTKEKGKGTGLGLSTVYGIVRQHEGWINVYSRPGEGTTFKIYLPVTAKKIAEHEESIDAPLHAPKGRPAGRILIVEDESILAKIAARILKSAGHSVVVATGVATARAAYERDQGVFDLVFTDVVLGDGNGVDLAVELQGRNPQLHVLFTSGYADERSRWGQIAEQGWSCLMKPFSRQALLDAVEVELLKHRNE